MSLARYRIADTIGQGGMGIIYKAYDRFTETWVALKQLHLGEVTNAEGLVTSPVTRDPFRLALASEFRLLVTLRHPHIVSVLDYGFFQATAFFTMEYLTEATPLVKAARAQPLPVQLRLLGQLLQALEYLRRHGVVHRDLKPANVLVQRNQVKVLDFGLAAFEGQRSTAAGSLLYMAPEAFDDRPHTHATDLYAVGVIAYEILAGQYPFDIVDPTRLVQQIFTVEPDCARLRGPAALQPVVARLLAKDPVARYATAAEALTALMVASEASWPMETQATRASFIQAAKFVGRAEELNQLTLALEQAFAGQGSAWLLGGESGVGKSRLLDELRVQALVRQAQVWRGQAVSEGGEPAQMWRNILRWLVLVAAPDDLEAAVLKPFVSQIEELVNRPLPEAPTLEAQAAQARFCATVLALLRRAVTAQPIILLLEDLHWMRPLSQALLAWVMRAVAELPVLIVATYRDDERPDLPTQLPPAHYLTLQRLTLEQITTLTSAIFGLPATHIPALVSFLYEKTEGNTFFVVEVLRNLAEEAGLLSQVQNMALPQHLLVGGIQQVIQRRLQKVSPADYGWLEVAALAGRQLDLLLLQHLDHYFDWAAWLSRCAEAAVLEPRGATWRFTHDQLRQGVLATLPAERVQALHLTIAEHLEQIYSNDLTPHLNRLVHHYTHTRQTHKQRHYLNLAGRTAQTTYDYLKALGYYEQLALLDLEATRQVDFQLRYGVVLEVLGRWPEAEVAYQAALAQATAEQRRPAMAQCQKALGTLARLRGDYTTALSWLAAAQTQADARVLAQTLTEIGNVYLNRSDYAQAKEHSESGLALARTQSDLPTAALALNNLGTSELFQGLYTTAHALFVESLALQRALGDKPGIALSLNNLGIICLEQVQYGRARDFFEECLALAREMGNKNIVGRSLTNLGHLACLEGHYATAETYHAQSLALRREVGNKAGMALSLENLGLVTYLQGANYPLALQRFAESLALSQAIGNKRLMQAGLLGLAASYAVLGQVLRAVQLAAAAETLRTLINLKLEAGEQQLYQNAVATGQEALSASVFAATWAAGTALTLEQAVALALEGVAPSGQPAGGESQTVLSSQSLITNHS